ncbi:BsaA family SipW-dependent biofilm matrix protein [Candidatus Saccharibacteria bacterium]|nr:BsaA family SipW-dependent biofilm matrix protein [Candidatus Saccharibacteria bacterium]
MKIKQKRVLIVACLAVISCVIGGTIAYFSDRLTFDNKFSLADDNVEFSETFDSPQNWMPCQEEMKTAVATNKSATNRYVRMKLNEYWRVKNSQTPATDHTTSDLPLTWTEGGVTKNYAVIKMQNQDKWELKSDGWYYYKTPLAQNASTDSLLESVTLNCDAQLIDGVSYSADGKEGTTIPSDYAEATYHLYITFQMSDTEYQ